MTNINNPTKKPQAQAKHPKHPKHPGVFLDAKGRMWTAEAIDQLIVGHVHGGYTFTPTAIYLSRMPHLSKITSEEAEAVFNTVFQKTEPPFTDWSSKPSSDAKVQEILKKIREALDDALTKYLSSHGHAHQVSE